MSADDEFIDVFLQECNDLLDNLEPVVVGFAEHTRDGPFTPGEAHLPALQEIFRLFHSIKGNAAYLDFDAISTTSHAAENLLDRFRKGRMDVQGGHIDLLCQTCDFLRQSLERVEADRSDQAMAQAGAQLTEQLHAVLEAAETPARQPAAPAAAPESPPAVAPEAAPETVPESIAAPVASARSATTVRKAQDLRVDLGKIDSLVNLVSELVIAKNMLLHSPDLRGLELEHFGRSADHMGKVIRELQEVAMAMRMVPVTGLFQRMNRLVLDLARKSGKKVEFVIHGSETEVDKTVIEKVTDPLVHLIRNAMDHGMEPPDAREAAGKPSCGTVRLSAGHAEGEVVIRLEDDGRGLNRERILAKALERGLLPASVGDGAGLSDREVAALIFEPGFSTAEQVTDLSGRGVGMDVVRQNIEQINGRIEIDSQPGQGTRITLRIPLTMAIMDGMLIRVGQLRYILPLLSVRESFRVQAGSVTLTPDNREMVRVRDRLFPILRLYRLHAIAPDSEALEAGILIVLESRGRHACLFVDEILGPQQTVVQGLSDYLVRAALTDRRKQSVSGCTIMGDGEICLILDPEQLLQSLE